MSWELVIFSGILVLSVILHLFFWLDSKKRYTDFMKQQGALNRRIDKLEESNEEMDKMLDEAGDEMNRIGEGIDELRSGRFPRRGKPTYEN